jgi:hypothetical protein
MGHQEKRAKESERQLSSCHNSSLDINDVKAKKKHGKGVFEVDWDFVQKEKKSKKTHEGNDF